MQLLDLFGELGVDLEQIPHDPVIGHLEDRRVFVLVDGDDDLGRRQPGEVLDRAQISRAAAAGGRRPAATTARDAPTAARPANAAASSSNTLKLAGSLSPRPPDTMMGASATPSVPASAALIAFTTTRPAGPAAAALVEAECV